MASSRRQLRPLKFTKRQKAKQKANMSVSSNIPKSEAATLTPAIEIKGLKKTYAKSRKSEAKTALRGVDLTVPSGSMFALLGPNGAGKSTLINILAGLVRKSAGEAKICGYDIDSQTRQARASIGIVPQEITMDVFFTPLQSLEIQAGYYGVPKSERRSEEILNVLGLWDKRHAYVRALSGGMKRRLLVGKALVHNPAVLILDEPTAGVDIELRRQLWDYVRQLHKSGTTVILTTHYLEEAESLCDRIAIIHNGQITANEPKDILMKRLDRRSLIITPKTPLAALPSGLSNLRASLTDHGHIAIDFRSGRDSIPALLSQVKAAGVSVADLRTQEPDLEDVFMSLTYDLDKT